MSTKSHFDQAAVVFCLKIRFGGILEYGYEWMQKTECAVHQRHVRVSFI